MGKKRRLVVDLGDLDFPRETEQALNQDIRRTVLRAIADTDFRGDLRFPDLPPGTYGIIMRPPDIDQF